MRSEPLIYLTYADMDPLVFETQVLGLCDLIQQDYDIPLQILLFLEEGDRAKVLPEPSRACSLIHVPSDYWQDEQKVQELLEEHIGTEAASVMCDDPRLAPLCIKAQEKGLRFFYHALVLHNISAQDTKKGNESLRAMEVDCFKRSDWVYASSEALINQAKLEAAYRDHNHSILPVAPITQDEPQAIDLLDNFISDEQVLFCYAGPIDLDLAPRALLECFAELLRHPNYRLLILSEQVKALDLFPFLQQEQCLMMDLPLKDCLAYMARSDYGILLGKPKTEPDLISRMIYSTYLSVGTKLVLSPAYGDISEAISSHDLGIYYAGRKENPNLSELKKTSSEERDRIRSYARETFDCSSALNKVKLRNLTRIHEGSV